MSLTFEFKQELKDDKPIIAICYDFDKTLTPTDMQAQGYIQSVFGNNVDEFWKESTNMAYGNDMDQNSAYMLKMMNEARGKEIFTKSKLEEYGKNIEYYKGLPDWFDDINSIAKDNGVIVEHYVISSGLKEIIDGTRIVNYFKRVYASQYYYDDKGVCVWPAQVVNYTNKTQFLFRISKGYLNVNDPRVNDKINDEDIRIPFTNIVYIGDSSTDIPCMRIVKEKNGHSIGVYDSNIVGGNSKVISLYKDGRLSYFAECDYSKESKLFNYIVNLIKEVKIRHDNKILESECKQIVCEYEENLPKNDNDMIKEDIIMRLNNSDSFLMTHMIIKDATIIDNWTDEQIIKLCRACIYNNQVQWIINDYDVLTFYKKIICDKQINDENVNKVRSYLK